MSQPSFVEGARIFRLASSRGDSSDFLMLEPILRGPPYLTVLTGTPEEPHKVTVLLGRELVARWFVVVDTIFSYEANLEAMEIHFPIRRFSMYDPTLSQSTYDRNTCATWIPEECKSHVMPIVLQSCDFLLDGLHPERLYYVTYVPLPPRAMGKYITLRDHLRNRGYTVVVDGGTDPDGRTFWELSL